VETIGSKRSYALTWCMPNNDDDDGGGGGPRTRLEQRPGCGYRQEQMAKSCCSLSCQGPEDLSAK